VVVKRRLFAGAEIRRLRQKQSLRQHKLAAQLGISASYLSQIENDERPLTGALIERIAVLFPLDWNDLGTNESERLAVAVREAAADPVFDEAVTSEQLARFVHQHPQLARQFVQLHEAFRTMGQRLEMMDEAIDADSLGQARLPWEEVRDWFHLANNYVDVLDRAAEDLSCRLCGSDPSPSADALAHHLRSSFSVSIRHRPSAELRAYNPQLGDLILDAGQPAQTQRFQLAHQLASLAFADEISSVVEGAHLRSPAARQLLFVGLSNYAAGALLMPYSQFRHDARWMRHDIDRISQHYGTSFEQTCHRLSTLQREHARGVPFFFCRVDMAGNITKRHSATRLQFARFGGACPLWIVHEAVAIPDRIQVQLAETPDGMRYISMAKGLVKPSGRFDRLPRRYAVALGCEVEHAGEFIYADGMDLDSERVVTRIGVSCRLCSRADCDQRSFPPSDREIQVDPNSRQVVPYRIT
jgi:predicted transcriptional regulator/transcriptional regulator with XRE-family HTH domain